MQQRTRASICVFYEKSFQLAKTRCCEYTKSLDLGKLLGVPMSNVVFRYTVILFYPGLDTILI